MERAADFPDGLTYLIPEGFGSVQVGDRVLAPLGKGDRPAAGFIIDIDVKSGVSLDRLKPILGRAAGALPPSLVELARWISRYYCAPLGVTLATMLPAAVKRSVGVRTRTLLERTDVALEGRLPPVTAKVWARIEELGAGVFPVEPRQLAQLVESKSLAPINRLIAAGALRTKKSHIVRASFDGADLADLVPVTLTDEQTRAVGAISAALGAFSVHLIRGVTGSGKTEVYLDVIARVLERGEGALVLVPEISLTPQTAARFTRRFRDSGVAVLHSGLTAAQRHHQWQAVATGEAKLVVGARSAVFAPFGGEASLPLGIIVVDEEHDGAYKQEEAPRHHARDVAIKRAQMAGCPIVLASATPSLESWRNATEGGWRLHELLERPAGAKLPRVEIVDFVEERRQASQLSRQALIGPRLTRAIQQTLDQRAQVILLLNRRGYANYICCPDQRCGFVLSCDDCDATMVYHKLKKLPDGGLVRCHHCLAEIKLPKVCPDCGKRISAFGMGTQRVEEELARLFSELIPRETMLRLDSDVIRSSSQWREALDRFARGEVRLLAGTQMIGKGLDFPNVRLVGVINADTALNLPDFRASERTFQLVTQVAGRAGRTAAAPGRVIVQTFSPHAPAIQYAANHDYRGFAEWELKLRKRAELPPATRMARIVVRDRDHTKAAALARTIRESLRVCAPAAVDIRGPMPCPISRIATQHRIAIELTAPSAGDIQQALTAARNDRTLRSNKHVAIDVDPIMLL